MRDAQQGLRLGDEGGDAGARPDRGGERGGGGGRRHGEHVERPLPAREGAHRLPDGAWAGLRPHVSRRARGRLRQGAVDGHLRRGLRPSTTSSPGRRRTSTRSSSLDRARAATASGAFAAELVAAGGLGEDEAPGRAKPEKIPLLKPAFREGGTVTAATSSSISDGGAALVVARRAAVEAEPLARIVGHASHAQAPAWFTTAPVFAIRKLLDRVGWRVEDVDLFEVNEAFAVVAMAAMRDLDIPRERLNVNGGACALGHPIGCSGARIVVTLVHALRARGLRRGVASLCIGGGEATAVAVEVRYEARLQRSGRRSRRCGRGSASRWRRRARRRGRAGGRSRRGRRSARPSGR